MKVYLAARYSLRTTMCAWRERLRTEGIVVTSRWIDGGHDIKDVSDADGRGDAERRRFGEEDVADIDAAHVLVVWSPREHFGTGRGGRHAEVGYAIGLGKPVILIGERENVFHWLPQVSVFPSLEAAIPLLRGEPVTIGCEPR